jgi:hypothetical protein
VETLQEKNKNKPHDLRSSNRQQNKTKKLKNEEKEI